MKRVLVLAALAAVTAAVGVSSVGAAPGKIRVSRTDFPDYLYTSAPGCPSYVPRDYAEGEAYGTTVTSSIKGWRGLIDPDTQFQQVNLRARLTGTIQDAAGNTYSVKGNFTDDAFQISQDVSDLVFDGFGRLSFSGPAGTVAGKAEFRFVTGPEEFTLTFTSITKCTVSS
jgi:hypothetical protein